MIPSKAARDLLEKLTYQRFTDMVSDQIVFSSTKGENSIFITCPKKFIEEFSKDLEENDYEFILDETKFQIIW